MEAIDETLSLGGVRGSIGMILVLVGTNPYSFKRLVRAADEYAAASGERMFIQLGNTDYIPKHAQHKRFLEREELLSNIRKADLVITQGGFGSIADCLRENKRVVAVPRKPELNEAPDRQEELVRELDGLGRLVGVYDIADLPVAIKKAISIEFERSQKHSIGELVREFIKDND